MKIIHTWILGLRRLSRWWHSCVSSPGAHCLQWSMECWDYECHHQGCLYINWPSGVPKRALAGMGNHSFAVTASLGDALIPRAAKNPQTMPFYIYLLLSYFGRVKIRVMLHDLQFKVSCIHHIRVCPMVHQGLAPSLGSTLGHLFWKYFQISFRTGHNLNACSPLNHLGTTHYTKHRE